MTKSSAGTKAEHTTEDANRLGSTTSIPSSRLRNLAGNHSEEATPASSRQSNAGSIRPSTAAVSFQQASETYDEALLARRLQLVQQMQAALADTGTVAYQSIAAYSSLLDGIVTLPCADTMLTLSIPDQVTQSSTCTTYGTGLLMDMAFDVLEEGHAMKVRLD